MFRKSLACIWCTSKSRKEGQVPRRELKRKKARRTFTGLLKAFQSHVKKLSKNLLRAFGTTLEVFQKAF
jgi:hypothetical protein